VRCEDMGSGRRRCVEVKGVRWCKVL